MSPNSELINKYSISAAAIVLQQQERERHSPFQAVERAKETFHSTFSLIRIAADKIQR